MIDFRKRPRTTVAAALSAAALLGAGGGAATYAVLGSGGETTIVRPAAVSPDAELASTTSGSTVAEIYKRTSRAVVEVTVSSGQGSGFVYDDEGHVITNHHVVDGAESVSVKFSDGSTYDGTVVGSDPYTDLAVIDVDAPASVLEPLELADSDELEVGDGAIAIGSPFGLEQTVTAGIVSALHRQITAPTEFAGFAIDDVIQTDAAINHGNSGGPLLDFEGRVIGVNSQIATAGGSSGNVGIGFAVPANSVRQVIPQLRQGQTIQRPFLGVSTGPAPSAQAGALVQEVTAGGPAARAGIRAGTAPTGAGGDVIVGIDGRDVRDPDDVSEAIQNKRPGETVQVEVLRDGSRRTVPVELGTRPKGTP